MHSLAWLLFSVLVVLALGQLVWGLSKRERHWQFPTLAGACWLFCIVPQAFGAVRNPDKFPPDALADGGLVISLVMCILCVATTWAGWQQGLMRRRNALPSGSAGPQMAVLKSETMLFWYGSLVFAVGFWAAWRLASLMGGFRAQFVGGANYEIEWLGAPVKYAFFAVLIYPGFLIAFRAWLPRREGYQTVAIILMALYPLATAVFLGRRSMTAAFVIIIACALYFYRRFTLPPLIMTMLFALAGVGVLVAPQYRTVASATGDVRRAAAEVNVKAALSDVLSGEKYVEFDSLVVTSAFLNRTRQFDYGIGLYNGLVNALVPRQIVGEENKAELLINLHQDDARSSASVYDWEIPYGSNPTGVLDAFRAFWFLGCLMYFGLAWCMARIWSGALKGSILQQTAYIILLLPAMGTVVGAWTTLPEQLIKAGVLLVPVHWICRDAGGKRLPLRSKRQPRYRRPKVERA